MNSEKINIIRSIEQMDAELFEMLLNIGKTYQYVRKSIFVNKFDSVFKELVDEGDTVLNSYPGMCKSKDCGNRFCSGYRFVGNVSKKYFELIFIEKRNEVDDIFHCSSLELDNGEENTGERIDIEFPTEEQEYFILNTDFQEKKKVYIVAMEELNQYNDTAMPFDVLSTWVNRYSGFFDSLSNVSILLNTFDSFKSIYIRLRFLAYSYKRNLEAKLAYEQYLLLDIENEKSILRWLVDHEKLGAEFHQFDVFNISKNGNDEIDGLKKGEINIAVENFRNCINFHFAFQEHIHEMKNKYYVEYDNPNDLPYYIDDVRIISDEESEFNRSLRLQLLKGGVEF